MMNFNISHIDCLIDDITAEFPVEGATAHEEVLFEIVNQYETRIAKLVAEYTKELQKVQQKYMRKKYSVSVVATDWCGYDSHYEVLATNEDEALELAKDEFVEEWDLILYDAERWGERDDFDEEGEPLGEENITGITANVEDA